MRKATEQAQARERAQTRRTLQALGKRVEKRRLEKGWNRTTLARKSGVTIATIRACEQGTKATHATKLALIARALGWTPRQLEADDAKDPRLTNWNDDDYEIGNWYHNAPRALKNQIWALRELGDVNAALLDPQFLALLERWPKLDQPHKNLVIHSFTFITPTRSRPDDDTGGVDAPPSPDTKIRGPQR